MVDSMGVCHSRRCPSVWLAEGALPSKRVISLISLFNLKSDQDVGSAKTVNEKMEADAEPRKAGSESISICQKLRKPKRGSRFRDSFHSEMMAFRDPSRMHHILIHVLRNNGVDTVNAEFEAGITQGRCSVERV